MWSYSRIVLAFSFILIGFSIFNAGLVAGQPAGQAVNESTNIEIDSSLTQNTEQQTVIVRLAERPENTVRTTSQKKQVASMKTYAAETQAPFERFASGNPHVEIKQEFWITNALVVTVDRAQIPLRRLGTVKNVERIHENHRVKVHSTAVSTGNTTGVNNISTSSSSSYTWGLEQINVPKTWDRFGAQGQGVDVAVLDTGVDDSHPDIQVERWKDFDDFPSPEPKDYGEHGTHVSGTVVGGNSSDRHIGVAPKADLWHGAVLTNCDVGRCSGSFVTITEGIQWATNNNADIVSMSLGSDGYDADLIDPIQNARQAGTLPIASSGNNGAGTSGIPGNVYESVAVGATDWNDDVAYYSSGEEIDTSVDWGSDAPNSWPESYAVPDIAAPGSAVYSSVPGGDYESKYGTSMAAPHVSGAAALVLSNSDTSLTLDEVENSLETTAVDLNEDATRQGSGRLNALAAVEAVADTSYFDVQITNISDPVVEGEDILVEYQVENVGEEADTQNIEFAVNGSVKNRSEDLSLTGAESTAGTFSYTTTEEDPRTVGVSVSSENDTATDTVSINKKAFFAVTITNSSGAVTEGENVTVDYEIENTGDRKATQNINFSVNDAQKDTKTNVTLTGGEKQTGSFVYQTQTGDAPNITAAVTSRDENATKTITVNKPAFYAVNITNISEQVIKGDTLVVDYKIENEGDIEATQNITVSVNNTVKRASSETLNGSESASETFKYQTAPGDSPKITIKIASEDENTTRVVEVNEPAFYTVAIDTEATDGTVTQGTTATVVTEIQNTGGVSATQAITLNWNKTETAEKTQSVSLNQSETKPVEFNYSVSEAAQTGEIPVQVSSKDDNETVTITVQEQGKSQLSNLQIGESGEAATILEGNQTDLSVVIENIGGAEKAFNITAEIAEDGAESAVIRYQNTTLSGADQAETVTFADVTSTLPDGAFNVTVETSDDTISGNLTVLKQGNLTVAGISAPGEARQNESVTVDGTLNNDGDVEVEQRIEFSAIDAETDAELVTRNKTVAVSGRNSRDISFNFTVPDDQKSNITAELRTKADNKNTTIESVRPRIKRLVVEESGSRINDTATITAEVANADTVTLGLTAEFTAFRTATDGTETTDPATSTGDTKTYTATIEQSALDDAGDGTFEPFAVATDKSGNEVTTTNESQTVIFDTTAPRIQLGINELGTTNASLTIDGNEAFNLTEVSIEAISDSGNRDEKPPTQQGFTKSTEVEFNGTAVNGSETRFDIKTVTHDQAGNKDTDTINSSITAYQIANNSATVKSDAVDSSFDLDVSEEVRNGEQRNATVAQSDAPPAGTETASDQIAGEFFNVKDIGLNDSELEEAKINIPVDEIKVEGFENDELVIFFSDGNGGYEPIETELQNNNLTATVTGFSGGAAGGIDNRPPTIDGVRVTPERTVDARDTDTVSVTVDYSPNISAINTTQTTASVTGTNGTVETQITKNNTEVTIREIENSETISVTVTVVDDANNEATVSETITVEAEQTDTTDDDDGSSGSGSSGGGAVGGSGGTPAGGSGPPTIQQVRDTLQLVTPQTDSETPLQDTDTEQPGLTVRPEQATSVNQITFNNEALSGSVRIIEYGTPPQVVSKKLRESIAADISELDTDDIEVSTVTEITPTVRATEDSSATVTLSVDRSEVDQPEALTVIKERYSQEAQTDRWAELETNITETTDQTTTIEAEVEAFSLFTVAEVEQGESAQPAANETETQTEPSRTTNDGIPGFGVTVAIITILLVSLTQRRDQ